MFEIYQTIANTTQPPPSPSPQQTIHLIPHIQFYTHLSNAHTIAHNTNLKPSCSKQTSSPTSIIHLLLLPQTLFVLYHHYHHLNKWELKKQIVMEISFFLSNLFNDEIVQSL